MRGKGVGVSHQQATATRRIKKQLVPCFSSHLHVSVFTLCKLVIDAPELIPLLPLDLCNSSVVFEYGEGTA
jgi:hypothetical protein